LIHESPLGACFLEMMPQREEKKHLFDHKSPKLSPIIFTLEGHVTFKWYTVRLCSRYSLIFIPSLCTAHHIIQGITDTTPSMAEVPVFSLWGYVYWLATIKLHPSAPLPPAPGSPSVLCFLNKTINSKKEKFRKKSKISSDSANKRKRSASLSPGVSAVLQVY